MISINQMSGMFDGLDDSNILRIKRDLISEAVKKFQVKGPHDIIKSPSATAPQNFT